MFSFPLRRSQLPPQRLSRFCVGVAALLLAVPGLAAAAQLQAIDYTAREGDSVQITLSLSEPAVMPRLFSLDKPARLSFDLPSTTLALNERLKRINIGKVRSVAAAEADGRSRIVVFLSEPLPHRLRVSGNKIVLELGESTAAVATTAPAAAVTPLAATAPVAAAPAQTARALEPAFTSRSNSLTNLDFRRGDRGEARINVTLSNPQTTVDVREEGGGLVAVFKDVSVRDSLLRRLDVLDFATPAKYIDTRRVGSDVRVTVTPVGDFEQVAYQSGNNFTIELQPLTRERIEEKKRTDPTFSGEKVSLSFQSVDVRALLQIIADVANVNMVVSDQVQGEMAMRLQNVPWDQALDIILRAKGLGQRREGNVIQVAPLAQLAERDKAELEALKQNRELAPLRSEIIQINYARASDLATLIKSKDSSQLSERGTATVDERTNTLLVLETRDKIAEIRELVTRLDIPVRQVLIESRIVIANNDYSKELGARFGASAIGRSASGRNSIATSGSADGALTQIGSLSTSPTGTVPVPSTLPLNFSIPGADTAGRIAFAILGKDYLLDLELSALQSEGRGEVISSPRVVTATGKVAIIEQGEEIPFTSSSGNAGATTQFKKATLALEVTPFITPDDRVQMDLSVKKDSRGKEVPQATGGTAVAIDNRRVDTSVLVENGDTIVLGGIYEETNRKQLDKVPFLGDLPFIGAFFRHNKKDTNKSELLIFITPKILKDGVKVD